MTELNTAPHRINYPWIPRLPCAPRLRTDHDTLQENALRLKR